MFFLVVFILLAIVIIVLRVINKKKFAFIADNDIPKYYLDPSNLSLYPTEVENVTVKRVHHGAAQGFHFIPNVNVKRGLVISFGGSDGTPGFEQAAAISQNGYETLALFMFGQKNQPKTLAKIPLEQFEDVLSYIDRDKIDRDTITLIGVSKGAEYALNIATRYPEVSNLILISPSAYTFNGLDFNHYGSSWTFRGEELPFISVKKASFTSFMKDMTIPLLTKAPISYKAMYSKAIRKTKDLPSKTISAANTKAKILLLAGEADQVWDSYNMALSIKDQRPENIMIRSYPGAGHTLQGLKYVDAGTMIIEFGGEEEGNQKAKEDAQNLILETLMSWHSNVLD